jgi:hypothetical protein
MALSTKEALAEAEKHLLVGMQKLRIDVDEWQKLYKAKETAGGACETAHSDVLVQLGKQIDELGKGRDQAVDD